MHIFHPNCKLLFQSHAFVLISSWCAQLLFWREPHMSCSLSLLWLKIWLEERFALFLSVIAAATSRLREGHSGGARLCPPPPGTGWGQGRNGAAPRPSTAPCRLWGTGDPAAQPRGSETQLLRSGEALLIKLGLFVVFKTLRRALRKVFLNNP